MPLSTSQMRTLPSPSPDASFWPTGDHATQPTNSRCPSSNLCNSPVSASQTRTVLSPEPEARNLPSGDQAISLIHLVCPLRVWSSLNPRGLFILLREVLGGVIFLPFGFYRSVDAIGGYAGAGDCSPRNSYPLLFKRRVDGARWHSTPRLRCSSARPFRTSCRASP